MEVLTKIQEPVMIHAQEIERVLELFKALKHEHRVEIVNMIFQNGRLTVTQILYKMKLSHPERNIEQSVVSQHLAILRDVKLVKTQRSGKNVFYSVNEEIMRFIMDSAQKLKARL